MENVLEKSNEFFDFESKEDRIKALETNMEEQVNGYVYSKPLTEFQIKEINVEINQGIAEVERIKEARKQLSKEISELDKKIKLNNKDVVRGYFEVIERVYLINNFETGFTERINDDGYIIDKTRFKEGSTMSLFNQKKDVV